jgi:ferredoxin
VTRIVVDADLCQGHAMCELEAPDVFAVPKMGPVAVVGEITDLEAVRSAVRHCPTQALTLQED